MKISIKDECKIKYRLDGVKIVEKIIEKIPNELIVNLKRIELHDRKKEPYPLIKYINEEYLIKIYMEKSDFTSLPFFSLLGFNIHFIMAINKHIDMSIESGKIHSDTVLSANRINYDWMYLGPWQFTLLVFKIFNYMYSRIKLIKNSIDRYIDFIWMKYKK